MRPEQVRTGSRQGQSVPRYPPAHRLSHQGPSVSPISRKFKPLKKGVVRWSVVRYTLRPRACSSAWRASLVPTPQNLAGRVMGSTDHTGIDHLCQSLAANPPLCFCSTHTTLTQHPNGPTVHCHSPHTPTNLCFSRMTKEASSTLEAVSGLSWAKPTTPLSVSATEKFLRLSHKGFIL